MAGLVKNNVQWRLSGLWFLCRQTNPDSTFWRNQIPSKEFVSNVSDVWEVSEFGSFFIHINCICKIRVHSHIYDVFKLYCSLEIYEKLKFSVGRVYFSGKIFCCIRALIWLLEVCGLPNNCLLFLQLLWWGLPFDFPRKEIIKVMTTSKVWVHPSNLKKDLEERTRYWWWLVTSPHAIQEITIHSLCNSQYIDLHHNLSLSTTPSSFCTEVI